MVNFESMNAQEPPNNVESEEEITQENFEGEENNEMRITELRGQINDAEQANDEGMVIALENELRSIENEENDNIEEITQEPIDVNNHIEPIESSGVNIEENNEADIEQSESGHEKAPISESVLSAFSEDLNITPEALESMEGFEDLSRGQQLMVLDNLKQLALGRIHEEAADAHASSHADKSSSASFLGKVWLGIKENMGGKQIDTARREKQSAEDILNGGIENHRDVMEQLVGGMSENGPEVNVNEKTGKLEVAYAQTIEGASESEQKVLDDFNNIANELGNIPYEWTLSTATEEQQQKAKEINEKYNTLKTNLFVIKEHHSESEQEVHEYVAKAENNIRMNQFLNTNPEVEEELMKLRDQSTIGYVMRHTMGKIGEKAGYMAGGFVARTVLVGAVGLIAAPVVAAGIGGMMGRKRANERVNEMQMQARKGQHSTTEGEKSAERNFVEANGENGLESKLQNLLVKLENFEDDNNEEEGENNKMSGREKLLESIGARIKYTERKVAEGLVDFGKSDVRLRGQYELTNTLVRAKATVDMLKVGGGTTERLNRVLGKKEEKIDEAQEKYIRNQMIKGAALGAGFAGAGALAADYMGTGEMFRASASEEIVKTMENISGVANDKLEMVFGMNMSAHAAVDETISELSDTGVLGDGAESIKESLHAEIGEVPSNVNAEIPSDSLASEAPTMEAQQIAPKIEIQPVSVEASSKGAIQTFVNLKEQLRTEYPDVSSRPPIIQKLLEQDAIESAKEYGFYNPNDIKESSMLLKGDQIRISENGALEYVKNNGSTVTLEDGVNLNSAEGSFGDKGGRMFDYDAVREVAEGGSGMSETMPNVESGPPIPTMEDMILAEEKAIEAVKVDVETLYGSDGLFGFDIKGEKSFDWVDIKDKPVSEIMALDKAHFELEEAFDMDDGLGDQKFGIDDEHTVLKTQEYIKKIMEESQIRPMPGETVEAYMLRANSASELVNIMEGSEVKNSIAENVASSHSAPNISQDNAIEGIIQPEQNVRVIVNKDIEELYGSDGFFGKKGEESIDWKDMKNRPVSEIMALDKGNFEVDELLDDDFGDQKFGIDDKDTVFKTQEYIKKLTGESQVRPMQGETLEAYMLRANSSVGASSMETSNMQNSIAENAQASHSASNTSQTIENVSADKSPEDVFGSPESLIKSVSQEGYRGENIDVTANFHKDSNGDIAGANYEWKAGKDSYEEFSKELLKPDWESQVNDMDRIKGEMIKSEASQINAMKKIMAGMDADGKTGTAEYSFLQNDVRKRITDVNKEYGNVFVDNVGR